MIAKYVMTSRGPIIFPDTFMYVEFSKFKPSSAGQVIIDKDGIMTFGDSLSLNLKPKENDDALIARAFGIKKIKWSGE